MFSFVIPSINDEIFESNMARSRIFHQGKHEFIVLKDHPSVRNALNKGIQQSKNNTVILMHEDVFLPDEFEDQFTDSYYKLKGFHGNHLGAFGAAGVRKGLTGIDYVGHIIDRGYEWKPPEAPSEDNPFLIVETLDELLIGFDKSSWTYLDESIPTHHMYGAELCLRAIKNNKANFAVRGVVHHNSKTSYDNLTETLHDVVDRMRPEFGSMFPFVTTCGFWN